MLLIIIAVYLFLTVIMDIYRTLKSKILTLFFSTTIFTLMHSPVWASAEKVVEHSETIFNPTKALITGIVMAITIIIIATESIHRTMIAFLSGTLLILVSETLGKFFPNLNLITLDQAFASIDMNVLGLLTGMMIIVGVLSETGVFEWMSVDYS